MLSKIIRLALGLMLIPVNVGYSIAFYQTIVSVSLIRTPELMVLFGITAYLAFHVLVAAPERAYLFGHELTHAAAAWMSGGKVRGFKVGSKKGSVATHKVTMPIALAPYLVPVYAILWAAFYGVARLFGQMQHFENLFFFGLGVALAFHLTFTVNLLKQKQSDLEMTGPLLGLGIIYWINIALVTAAISWVMSEVHFIPYLIRGYQESQQIFQVISSQLFG